MADQKSGISVETAQKIATAGEVAITTGVAVMSTAALGPIGPIVAVPTQYVIEKAPPEAKLAGGVGAAMGGAAALKGIALVGGVALAPAAATIACAAAVVGGVGLLGAWAWKKLSS